MFGGSGFIPQLDYFCCGCQLHTGSKVAGWYGVVLGTFTLLHILIQSLVDKVAENESDIHTTMVQWNWVIRTIFIFTIILMILRLPVSILLLIGVYQKKVSYYLPWIIFSIVIAAMALISLFLQITQHALDIIIILCSDCMRYYFILVVYSDYKQLKQAVAIGQGVPYISVSQHFPDYI